MCFLEPTKRNWPNDSVNRDAEISPPTPETEIGGSGSTHCSPLFAFMSEQIGGNVFWGPELRFTPEPQRVENRLVLDENTKMEVFSCSQ